MSDSRDTVHLTLRKGTVHVIGDATSVGYVNLLAGTAFVLPIDEFEHAVRLAQVERRRKGSETK